jgi:hypothetical protein
MFDRLVQELEALVATVEDPSEAEALRALFALAAELEVKVETEADHYKPFVYPH